MTITKKEKTLKEQFAEQVTRCLVEVEEKTPRRSFADLRFAWIEAQKKKMSVADKQDVQEVFLDGFTNLVCAVASRAALSKIAYDMGRSMVALDEDEQSTGLTRTILSALSVAQIAPSDASKTLNLMSKMEYISQHAWYASEALLNIVRAAPENPKVLECAEEFLKRRFLERVATEHVRDNVVDVCQVLLNQNPERVDIKEKIERLQKRRFPRKLNEMVTPFMFESYALSQKNRYAVLDKRKGNDER